MRTFADRANKFMDKQNRFWHDLENKKRKLAKAFVKKILANPDYDGPNLPEEEKALEERLRSRLKKHRIAFAKVLRKHRHEPIGLGIGGRDCDGYDWESIRLFDNTDYDRTDPDNYEIKPRGFGCAYWQAVKSARSTMDGADGPTGWGFMTPEDVKKYHAERDPNEPVGRCGWDDDSMEPWTPEQVAEGWPYVGDGLGQLAI